MPRISRLEWTAALGVAAAVATLALSGVVAYRSVARFVATADAVRHTQEVLTALETLSGELKDAHRGERGYVITGDPTFLAPYVAARRAVPARLAHVRRLTADRPAQQARLLHLQALTDAALADMADVVRLRREQGVEAARAYVARGGIEALMHAADEAIGALEWEERVLLRTRSERAERSASWAMAFVGATSGLGLALLLAAAALVLRDGRERRRAERALRESREQFRRLVDTAGSAIVAFSPDLRITEFNRDAERISRVPRAEALGRPLRDLFGDQPGFPAFAHVLERALRGIETKAFDATLTSRRGERHVMLWNVDRLTGADGEALGVIAVGHEITLRKRMEEALRHEAAHDPLTGYLNRRAFLERLGGALAGCTGGAAGTGGPCGAVLYLDLDRFKPVNDRLGHHAGDGVLAEAARRTAGLLRPGDALARLGGDEFAVLLAGPTDRATAAALAADVAAVLARPYAVGGHEVFAPASVGVVPLHDGYDDPEEVLRDADAAMYRSKTAGRAGRGGPVVFEAGMAPGGPAFPTEADLRGAFARDEFVVHYQPLVRLADGQLTGFEGLVRWRHPERGLVPPGAFLPLVEETGLLGPLGDRVLDDALRSLHAWDAAAPPGAAPLMVSVNVAREQLLAPDAAPRVAEALRAAGVAPGRVILEITEGALERDAEAVIAALPAFRAVGVRLWLDDFGTRFSSLSALLDLPVAGIKLDRSFVARMAGADGLAMVRALTDLAHRLGREVVAEGIETPEQLAVLRAVGCELGQGFFLARPLGPEAVRALLADPAAWQPASRDAPAPARAGAPAPPRYASARAVERNSRST